MGDRAGGDDMYTAVAFCMSLLPQQPFYGTLDFVWDYPGELVPKKVKPGK